MAYFVGGPYVINVEDIPTVTVGNGNGAPIVAQVGGAAFFEARIGGNADGNMTLNIIGTYFTSSMRIFV